MVKKIYNETTQAKMLAKLAKGGSTSSAKGGGMIKIKYEDLKKLRDNGKLVPGQQYRIIDYNCTTIQPGTYSAGHYFDIIVTADTSNRLNENARACNHNDNSTAYWTCYFVDYQAGIKYIREEKINGVLCYRFEYQEDSENLSYFWFDSKPFDNGATTDSYGRLAPKDCYVMKAVIPFENIEVEFTNKTEENEINNFFKNNAAEVVWYKEAGSDYFATSNLEAWELKYCLDNDETRFAWASNKNTVNGTTYETTFDIDWSINGYSMLYANGAIDCVISNWSPGVSLFGGDSDVCIIHTYNLYCTSPQDEAFIALKTKIEQFINRPITEDVIAILFEPVEIGTGNPIYTADGRIMFVSSLEIPVESVALLCRGTIHKDYYWTEADMVLSEYTGDNISGIEYEYQPYVLFAELLYKLKFISRIELRDFIMTLTEDYTKQELDEILDMSLVFDHVHFNKVSDNIIKPTGVIYYMKDEFGNEASYDFKNIYHQMYRTDDGRLSLEHIFPDMTPYPRQILTFDGIDPLSSVDATIPQLKFSYRTGNLSYTTTSQNNKITPYYSEEGRMKLPKVSFVGDSKNNTIFASSNILLGLDSGNTVNSVVKDSINITDGDTCIVKIESSDTIYYDVNEAPVKIAYATNKKITSEIFYNISYRALLSAKAIGNNIIIEYINEEDARYVTECLTYNPDTNTYE